MTGTPSRRPPPELLPDAAPDLPQGLVDNPRLSQWIGFEPDGAVRIGTGKVELGQGILTALAQMAAEELEVAPERIHMVSGLTGRSPEEGFTAGSRSVEGSGGAIRVACAEVRAMAVAEAARRLGCEPGEIGIEDGRFLRGGAATGLGYADVAGALDLDRPATGSAPVRPAPTWRWLGRSLPRIDLPGILDGGSFLHDLRPEGLLHARVLRRPHPRARLASLDKEAVRRRVGPGVTLVRLRDFVAVAAEDEAVAERALEAVRRAAVWEGAGAAGPAYADPLHLRTLPTDDRTITVPPAAPAGGEAVRTLTATFTRPYLAHGSIGPSCALARWDGAGLEVLSHTQGVGPLRAAIARTLQLDPALVTVRHHPGAGCYGHNGADDAALDAAVVAVQCPGRSVRVRWSREDEMAASPVGAASVLTLRAGQAADGRVTRWELDLWSPTHGQRPGANGEVNLLAEQALTGAELPPVVDDVPDSGGGGGNRNAVALYDLPGQHIVHHLVRRGPLRTSSLRGLGAQANVFAIESFVDELGEAAGQDPLSYRLAMLSDPRARAVLEAAAAMAPWTARGPGGEGTGFGLAFSRYKNRAAYLAAVAEVEVDEAVRVRRLWCAVDAGLVVNPDGAANQIEGGAVQAASWTLKEAVRTDASGIATRTWPDYPILTFSEVPEVEVRFVGSADDPPLGVGEAALGPVTAAIANAVAHALGARIRDLPLTRERVMATLLGEDT